MNSSLICVAITALALTAGCGKKDSGSTAAPNPEAQAVYAQRCSACHGADGKGTGAAAAALTPKPRNYADAAWQKSVTDDQLKKAIVGGGAAIGKSAMMPPNPDLEGKPEVVTGLVGIIRGFGKLRRRSPRDADLQARYRAA